MRWLLRFFIFWLIMLPLFYLFGLPWLMGLLSEKARTEAYGDCFRQLREQQLIDAPTAIVRQPQAETYCHCVSAPITLTRDDLPDLIKKRPPERLNALMKPVIEGCNADLQRSMTAIISGARPPETVRQPDGTEVIHF